MAERTWFVVAAAGSATRFGGRIPKPYAVVARRTLLEHALRALLAIPAVSGGVVVLAPGDRRFGRLPAKLRGRLSLAEGGTTRAESVLNGLAALREAAEGDWVLVHDAARPCLGRTDVLALLKACRRDPVGGLLATPLADTLKRADAEGRSEETVSRERLWRAQTPQMFRRGPLERALARARAEGVVPTDESAALERLGQRPRLVEGSPLNLKVTRPADLAFAGAVLARRGKP